MSTGVAEVTQDTVQLDLPGTIKYLNVLGAVIEEVLIRAGDAATESIRQAIRLAVHEACTNIALHAYSGQPDGRIGITITLYTNKLVVMLRDTGRPFDLSAQPEPALGTPQIHGFGLFLMKQLLDEVSYRATASGNHWRLVKYL